MVKYQCQQSKILKAIEARTMRRIRIRTGSLGVIYWLLFWPSSEMVGGNRGSEHIDFEEQFQGGHVRKKLRAAPRQRDVRNGVYRYAKREKGTKGKSEEGRVYDRQVATLTRRQLYPRRAWVGSTPPSTPTPRPSSLHRST